MKNEIHSIMHLWLNLTEEAYRNLFLVANGLLPVGRRTVANLGLMFVPWALVAFLCGVALYLHSWTRANVPLPQVEVNR